MRRFSQPLAILLGTGISVLCVPHTVFAFEDEKKEIVLGAAGSSNQSGSTGSQLFGFRIKPKDTKSDELEAVFSITPKKQLTNKSANLGSSLLSPDTDSQMWQIRYLHQVRKFTDKEGALLDTLHFYGRYSSTNFNFTYDSGGNNPTVSVADGTVSTLIGGILIDKTVGENEFTYGVLFGFTARQLSGDITISDNNRYVSGGITENDTTKRGSRYFASPEIGFFFRKGDILLSATRTNFGGQIKGFSTNQVVISMSTLIKIGTLGG